MRDIWFQQILVTHPKHVFVYDFHTLFFNLACFWTLNDVRAYIFGPEKRP